MTKKKKKGEDSSDPIYANPIKNLPNLCACVRSEKTFRKIDETMQDIPSILWFEVFQDCIRSRLKGRTKSDRTSPKRR